MKHVALCVLWLAACAHPPAGTTPAAGTTTQRDGTEVQAVTLPARFEHDRIFLVPVMADGTPLRLFTDTGGGSQFLYEDTVARLGMETTPMQFGEETFRIVSIPRWRKDAAIPAPLAIDQPPALRTHFMVLPRSDIAGNDDGFLGQGFFGGRVWTFDYPMQTFLWHPDGALPPHDPADAVPLHLPERAEGRRTLQFGRITVRVDGEPIDVLFDTGATLRVSKAGREALGEGTPSLVGTSFIVESIFERWRARHPEWRVVEAAEEKTGFPIIEVPEVELGRHKVGPVWFTRRRDRDFHEYMSSMTDARIEGAIGGSAFKYLRVSADYANGTVVFTKPQRPPARPQGHSGGPLLKERVEGRTAPGATREPGEADDPFRKAHSGLLRTRAMRVGAGRSRRRAPRPCRVTTRP